MENNERDRKLDQWLDETLSEYNAAEPRFGLEQRILNRVRGEERRSQKWNFWRWMPAFGAIAALVVVAVAVRPVLERKKAPALLTNSRIDTYARPAEETAKNDNREALSGKAAAPATKARNRAELNDELRGAPVIKRELAPVPQNEIAPQSSDRDKSTNSRSAGQGEGIEAAQADLKKAPSQQKEPALDIAVGGAIELRGRSAAAPPPPPPQVVTDKDLATSEAAAVPAEKTKESQASANADGVEAPSGIVGVEQLTAKSLAAMEPKDRKQKRERDTAEAARQNASVMEVFGVKVRFENYPTPQQFPTPVPLSNQEKLALKVGPALKDTATAQHKSAEISPIEIKNIEIKPLEGPEKEK